MSLFEDHSNPRLRLGSALGAACLSAASALVLAPLAHAQGAADTLDPIRVGGARGVPAMTPVAPGLLSPGRESAEALRDVPGVSGSRMGGHGTDPAVRGLSQTRLNILLDGAYVHGACPNRMDPPTSYAPPAGYEAVTVIKGVQTLEYGGGGPGGTILFERETQPFVAGESLRGRAEAGFRGNSDTREVAGDLAAGGERGYLRALVSGTDAGNYEDGSGNPVRSSFAQRSGTLVLGYTPSAATRLEFTRERQDTDDVLFPGAGMDGVFADHDGYRLKFRTTGLSGPLADLKVEVYRSEVRHLMDNYTLRPEFVPPRPDLRAPSTSDTTGGRVVAQVDSGVGRWKLGLEVQNRDREAARFNDSMGGVLNSVLWPGVAIDQRGVFAELTHPWDDANRLVAGVRYDRVSAEAGDADRDPPGMPLSPNALYGLYYDGARAEDRDEDNWGGLVRLEHDLASGLGTLYAGFSRSVRTADASERFLGSNGMTPDDRWVGNPLIEPERHHQLEAGARLARGPWDVEASLFHNRVQDFILRDRFHGADPRLGNATVYRNVDATLWGGELELGYRWSRRWRGSLGLAYVEAENTSDDRAIAQTPPLEAVARVDYARGPWEAGVRVRAAATQTRVDADPATGSGLDVGETPGWAVLDLHGRYQVGAALWVDFGVDNLLDKTYAQHLNRASAFDPTQVQVNEPGRSAWVRVAAEF